MRIALSSFDGACVYIMTNDMVNKYNEEEHAKVLLYEAVSTARFTKIKWWFLSQH